jgi:hypothetical protein
LGAGANHTGFTLMRVLSPFLVKNKARFRLVFYCAHERVKRLKYPHSLSYSGQTMNTTPHARSDHTDLSHNDLGRRTPTQVSAPKLDLILFGLLALSMAATRYHHFSNLLHIADTSWAVFFIAGYYLRPRWMFPALLSLAVAIDLAAVWVDGTGISGCFSPAYPGLLLAYTALWSAGRLASMQTLPRLINQASMGVAIEILQIAGWLTLGVLAAFALSNLTFWAWSGHFTQLSLGDYTGRVMGYLGRYLSVTSFYVSGVVAALMLTDWLKSETTQLAAH